MNIGLWFTLTSALTLDSRNRKEKRKRDTILSQTFYIISCLPTSCCSFFWEISQFSHKTWRQVKTIKTSHFDRKGKGWVYEGKRVFQKRKSEWPIWVHFCLLSITSARKEGAAHFFSERGLPRALPLIMYHVLCFCSTQQCPRHWGYRVKMKHNSLPQKELPTPHHSFFCIFEALASSC